MPAPQLLHPALLSHVACLSQEMTIKHEEKKAKREARQAAKAGWAQAAPVTHGQLCAAVEPRGSPVSMQLMQSYLPPICEVMLAPM